MPTKLKKDIILYSILHIPALAIIIHSEMPFYFIFILIAIEAVIIGLNYYFGRISDKTLHQRLNKQLQQQSLEYDKFRQDYYYEAPVKEDIISDLRYRYTQNPLAISFSSPVKKFAKAYASQLDEIEKAYMNGRMITSFLCGVNISSCYVVMYDQHSIKAIPADKIVTAQIRCSRFKYGSADAMSSGDMIHYYFAVLTEGSTKYDMILLGSMKSRMAYDELFRAGILRKNNAEQCPQLYDDGKLTDIDLYKMN